MDREVANFLLLQVFFRFIEHTAQAPTATVEINGGALLTNVGFFLSSLPGIPKSILVLHFIFASEAISCLFVGFLCN